MNPLTFLMRTQVRAAKLIVTGLDVGACRASQDRLGALTAKVLAGRVRIVPAAHEHGDAAWAEPLEPHDGRAILYLHGGGYVAGSLEYALGFGSILADVTQYRTLCVGYRLAPEDPYPAAVDDALACYKTLLENYPPEGIAFVGESAGGGLCFALALRARDEGLPLPAAIAACSPWTDLTMTSDSVIENSMIDPCLSPQLLKDYAKMYAGDDVKNPYVSPLFGDLTGLPPSLIITGSDEILVDDSTKMGNALARAGVSCTLMVEKGMWHVFPLYGTVESKAAIGHIHTFLDVHTKDGTEHERSANEA